jgi:hypothetical protein
MTRIAAVGAYGLSFTRYRPSPYRPSRFHYRRCGRATPWPWRELTVPFLGAFVIGRTRPLSRTAETGLNQQ